MVDRFLGADEDIALPEPCLEEEHDIELFEITRTHLTYECMLCGAKIVLRRPQVDEL